MIPLLRDTEKMRGFKLKIPIRAPNKRHCATLCEEAIRVRFAPSPTGFLHLGGLRTALYNHLFAKSKGGKLILRIEDTDQTRLVEGAVKGLQRDLSWAGIEVHEGPETQGDFGPYIQSERLEHYKEHIETLLTNGSAYYCFCTERRLELLRKEAVRAREVPKYDNKCRKLDPYLIQEKLAKSDFHCIRFKLTPGAHSFHDLIYGTITYDTAASEGDPVIMKSDGFPTYHFANVVDDHLMRISHVLRGAEWQISTMKHILMYRAFNWKPPAYGHLPLLMNADGSKLSKRQGDMKLSHFRDIGIYPLALINFIVNSGGGFEKDSERNVKPRCRTVDELAQQFDISRINSHPGKLMPERLLEFNRLELKRRLQSKTEEDALVEQVIQMVQKHFPESELNSEFVKSVLHWSTDRITKLSDLLSSNLRFVWIAPRTYNFSDSERTYVRTFIEDLSTLQVLKKESLNGFLKSFVATHKLKSGPFMKTIRSALSGLKEGPSVAEMMEILGKENTIDRLRSSIKNNK